MSKSGSGAACLDFLDALGKRAERNIIGYPVPEVAADRLVDEFGESCADELTEQIGQGGSWPFWKAMAAALYLDFAGDARAEQPLRALAASTSDPRVSELANAIADRLAKKPPSDKFELEVVVEDKTAQPEPKKLKGAIVAINAPGISAITTNSEGFGRFPKLKAGQYKLTATHQGFLQSELVVTLPRQGAAAAAKAFAFDAGGPGPGDPDDQPIVIPMAPPAKLLRLFGFAPVSRLTGGNPIPAGATGVNPQSFQNLTASKSKETDLAKNAPVVLLRGMGQVLMEAETNPPGQKVLWDVAPAGGHSSTAPQIDPITSVNGNKAMLHTDKAGAYSVNARVSAGDAPLVWNVVFVDVAINSSTARGNGPNEYLGETSIFNTKTLALLVKTGDHAAGSFGWSATADTTLSAPGARPADFDNVELHMLQNGTTDSLRFDYLMLTPTTKAVSTRENVTRLPALDTEDLKGTITPDKHFPGGTAFSSTPATGSSRALKFFDTPNTLIFPIDHETQPTAKLAATAGEMGFRVGIAAVSKAAPHSIVVYADIKWVANFEGSVTLAMNTKLGMIEGTWGPAPALAGTKTPASFTNIPGGSDAGDQGFEVWPPNLLNQLSRVPDP